MPKKRAFFSVHELEQLARCSVVISRAIVVNMMKVGGSRTLPTGDLHVKPISYRHK